MHRSALRRGAALVAVATALLFGVGLSGRSFGDTTPTLTITPAPTIAKPGQEITFTFSPKLRTGSDTLSFQFGDGSTEDLTGAGSCQILGGCDSVTHAYSQVGTYAVTATGTISGVQVSGSTQVTIQTVCTTPAPSAGFAVGTSSIRPWQAVQFTDLSTGDPTAWSWDFGDGSALLKIADGTSDQQNPVYAFRRAGTFTVTLTASNCKGSSQSQVSVRVVGDCPATGGTGGGLGCWASLGPYGGFVTALAEAPSDPSVVYAGIRDGGIFKSSDRGRTWARAGAGVPSRYVAGLAVDALDPQLAYAAGTPLLRTQDGGATWTVIDLGLPTYCSTLLAADPRTANSVWLGTCSGLFKSTDGGARWFATSFDGVARGVVAIAIDPTRPDTMYVVADGLRKTVDGGANWELLGSLPLSGNSPFEIAIDPRSPDTVYVSSNGGGVFKTTDGGASWAALNVLAGGIGSLAIQLIEVDPDNSGTVYAEADTGLFRTTDGGSSWNLLSRRNDVSVLAADPTTSGRILAGLAGGGVLVSSDGGSNWAFSSTGLVGVYVNAVAADPTTPKVVFAATENQWVLKTTDGGITWTTPSGWPLGGTGPAANALAIDPTHANTLYLGTLNAVVKTTDGGVTWPNVSQPSTAVSGVVLSVALSAANPSTVYAATQVNGTFRSVDGGVGWTAVNSGINDISPKPATTAVAVDPATADTAYLATLRLGAYKTTNGGATWVPINNGLPTLSPPNPTAFAVDPVAPTTVYVGMENLAGAPAGVYKTLDGGQHWTAAGGEIAGLSVYCIAIDPANHSTVYAGTQGGGVFRSTDAGASWHWMSDGLDSLDVTSIAFDGGDPNLLYAGTATGVYSTAVPAPPARARRHLRRSGP